MPARKAADLAPAAVWLVLIAAVACGAYWWRMRPFTSSVGTAQIAADRTATELAPAAAPASAAPTESPASVPVSPPAPTPEPSSAAAPEPTRAPAPATASRPASRPSPSRPRSAPTRDAQVQPAPAAPAPASPPPAPPEPPPTSAPAAAAPAPASAPESFTVRHLHSRSIKRLFVGKNSCEGTLQLLPDGIYFKTTKPGGDRPPEEKKLTFGDIRKVSVDDDSIRIDGDNSWEFVGTVQGVARVAEHIRSGKSR